MSSKWILLGLVPACFVIITHLLHVYHFAGPTCGSKTSLRGKTVIVTGANTGIGRATAMDMAERGARVILACRSEKRAAPVVEDIVAKTGNREVVFMELDLSSFTKVQRFTDEFLRKEARLDILINNAGMISTEAEKPVLTENGIEITLAVNHLGPFLLTNNLLGILGKSGPGSRVVTVSSTCHHWANARAFENLDELRSDGAANFTSAERATTIPSLVDDVFFSVCEMKMKRYSNSKLANVLFSKELAKRTSGSGVSAYSLHPGAVMTEFGVDRDTGKGLLGTDRKTKSFVQRVVSAMSGFVHSFTFPFKTMEEGAQTSICCAVSEEFEGQSGLYYADCAVRDVVRPELNDEFTARFWEWSENLIRQYHEPRRYK